MQKSALLKRRENEKELCSGHLWTIWFSPFLTKRHRTDRLKRLLSFARFNFSRGPKIPTIAQYLACKKPDFLVVLSQKMYLHDGYDEMRKRHLR